MATYLYPTSTELTQISPEFVTQNIQGDPLLNEIMPIVNVNAAAVDWTQGDSYYGLQQLRGLDGSPQHVQRLGSNQYSIEPGAYGEFQEIRESELTKRAVYAGNQPIDIGDLVSEAQQYLLRREIDRIRYIGWTLLLNGTYTVSMPGTGVAHRDTYTFQSQNRAVDWDTVATATPFADFRAVQLKGAAKGVDFGAGRAYMNRTTANKLLSITNTADIGGRRTVGGGTINSIAGINILLMGEGLPEIVVYDGGYQTAANSFSRWIADDKVICIGKRVTGETVLQYKKTRNINAPGMVGSYTLLTNSFTGENTSKVIPGKITVHQGHNGGPAVYFPGSICILSV